MTNYNINTSIGYNTFAKCIGYWDNKNKIYIRNTYPEQIKCCKNTCDSFFVNNEDKDNCKKLCDKFNNKIKKIEGIKENFQYNYNINKILIYIYISLVIILFIKLIYL